jgi:recombinational DNA repair protein (RecF pathway)
MYHKYNIKGIVIYDYEEGADSKKIAILSKELGLILAKVQSGRVLNSKLRSNIQNFSTGLFSLVSGKGGWKLVGAKTEKNYFELLKSDLIKVKVMANVASLLKRLLQGEEVGSNLFTIVSNFFEFMVKAKREEIFFAECLVLLRILNQLGFLANEPKLEPYLKSLSFEEEMFLGFSSNKGVFVSLINQSLRAT